MATVTQLGTRSTSRSRIRRPRSWKRLIFLAHRWTGVTLGILVAVWFTSGIVMMYYSWPNYTDSELLRQLKPFDPPVSLVGFAAAERAALSQLPSLTFPPSVSGKIPVGGRLMQWRNRLAYQVWGEQGTHWTELALVDARTGAVLSPISASDAASVAAEQLPAGTPVITSELLSHGDYYMENRDYRHEFPAYRVRFGDSRHTAIYVEQRGGTAWGAVTQATRVTTWLGTVPHWLYFQWLLDEHEGLWRLLCITLPAAAVSIALTGIVFGLWQLFPSRRQGRWRVTAYQGLSKWHHVAGVVFGVLVLTWTFTGILENVGPSTMPLDGQASVARGGPIEWAAIRVTEAEAIARIRRWAASESSPVAVDLLQFRGSPGYDVHMADGREYWVDAARGEVRQDMSAAMALGTARQLIGGPAPVQSITRLTHYDAYYYAHHSRERRLPVWRVLFRDASRSAVYLDAINGAPLGFADQQSRAWRWARDGLHTFDYPLLNNRRPAWDLVVLPLMVGGAVSALTGAWLLVRRVLRSARGRSVS